MYEPHGICLNWESGLVVWHAISDGLIALAYLVISTTLLILKIRGKLIGTVAQEFGYLFALFIFLCGTTHIFDILVIWWPIYYWQLGFKAATAVVSMLTAVFLAPSLWGWLIAQRRNGDLNLATYQGQERRKGNRDRRGEH